MAHRRTGNDDVAGMKRTVLNQDSHDGAAALIQAGFHNGTLGCAVGVGLEFLDLGQDDQILQKIINTHAGFGRNGADNGLAAPLFGNDVILGQLLLDTLGVGAHHVHLVDGNHQGNTGCFGVVDGLNGLRHNAVVRCNHKNGNIGDHGATGTHGGKGFMARSIQEGNGTAVDINGISTDMLGNAAGFAGGNVGIADIVQKRRLTVVNVSHDHDNRSSGQEIFFSIGMVVNEALFHGNNDLTFHLAAHFHGDQGSGVVVDHIRDGSKHAQLDQLLDDFRGRLLHAGSQLANADLIGDLHLKLLFLGNFKLQLLDLIALFLAALGRSSLLVALLILVIELFLAAALLIAALTGKIFKLLVVLGEVGVGGATGIDHALFRHRAGNMILLFACRLLCGGLLLLLCRLGRFCLLGGVFALFCHRFFLYRSLGRRLGRFGKDFGDAVDLVMLGQILKNQIQFIALKNLHVVFGSCGIFRENLGDHLGRHVKILGNLVDPVFIKTTHMLVLLFPSFLLR